MMAVITIIGYVPGIEIIKVINIQGKGMKTMEARGATDASSYSAET